MEICVRAKDLMGIRGDRPLLTFRKMMKSSDNQLNFMNFNFWHGSCMKVY